MRGVSEGVEDLESTPRSLDVEGLVEVLRVFVVNGDEWEVLEILEFWGVDTGGGLEIGDLKYRVGFIHLHIWRVSRSRMCKPGTISESARSAGFGVPPRPTPSIG